MSRLRYLMLVLLPQNFPFKYHNRKPFVAKLLAFTGVSFSVPFAAVEFTKYVIYIVYLF